MRKVIVWTFVTLDGVLQGPGGPEEDRSGGFAHGGWVMQYWDDMMDELLRAAYSRPFDLLLGRGTYEIFAAHWPYIPKDHPDADAAAALNRATKYVASKTLKPAELTWATSRLIRDGATEIAELKRTEGPELLVHGSGNLVQTLLRSDLVDEFRIWTFPVVLGEGKRLFMDGTQPRGLKLMDGRTSTTGVMLGSYQPAGAVKTGSLQLEKPTPAEVKRREKVARG